MISMRFDDPQISVWFNSTLNILNQTFGRPNGEEHTNTEAFICRSLITVLNRSDDAEQRDHVATTRTRKALLEGFIEQLEDLAPPSSVTAPDQYVFHSEIRRVSDQLYRDGHYKQAALEAHIRVIDEVRRISGLPEDGDRLIKQSVRL